MSTSRNSLQPRPPRFSQASFASSPPGTGRRSHADISIESSSRGVKRSRAPSPFRQASTRNRSHAHASSSSSSAHTALPFRPRLSQINVSHDTSGISSNIIPSEPLIVPPVRVGNSNSPELDDETNQRQSRDQEYDDEEEDKDIIMAVDYRGKRLGCTFYTEEDETLWFVNDIQVSMFGPEGGAAKEVLESLKFQIQPTVILFPARADELFTTTDASGNTDTETITSIMTDLSIRPASEFSVEQGKNKLASLTFDAENLQATAFMTPTDAEVMAVDGELRFGRTSEWNANGAGHKQSILRLDSYIDTEGNYVSVGCAGAVLIHVRRKKQIQDPYADPDAPNDGVSRIKLWTMENSMFINADTMTSLQIFSDESHPTQNTRGKEGLSLFSIVNNTKTPQGYQYLKQMFLRPSLDATIITARHNAIHALNRPDNSNAVGGINKSLKKVPDIVKTLTKLKKGGSTGAQGQIEANDGKKKVKTASTRTWCLIFHFAFNAIKIRSYVVDMLGTQDIDIFRRIAEKFEITHLQTVAKMIDDKVDFEESKYHGRVCVKAGVNGQLDHHKNTYNNFSQILTKAAEEIFESFPQDVQDLGMRPNVVYYPQLGYLLAVPLREDGQPVYSGDTDDENNWIWEFATDFAAYFKTNEMHQLNDEIGDVFNLISDMEIEILYQLQEKILEYRDILITCSDLCGELDSLLSFAQAARANSWVRPLITDRNIIQISSGRHPLQELCVQTFIPNNTNLQGGAGGDAENTNSSSMDEDDNDEEAGKSMMIVTGPNYSGKSVYLKQVALTVYMAHIGSYVPAESATIGLTDAILTRIQTKESVTKTQSAFMIDLQQVAAALRLTSRRSLLVIDEFGKGTESTDGAGLACAVAEHLLQLGPEAPKTLMATHYHEIFENGFLTSHPSLAFGHMKILLGKAAHNAQNQITYLYTLSNGRSTSSFGTVCAAMNGVEKAVVDRAEDLIVKLAQGEDLVSACAAMSPSEAREFACAEHIARRFLQIDLDTDLTDEEAQISNDDPGSSCGDTKRTSSGKETGAAGVARLTLTGKGEDDKGEASSGGDGGDGGGNGEAGNGETGNGETGTGEAGTGEAGTGGDGIGGDGNGRVVTSGAQSPELAGGPSKYSSAATTTPNATAAPSHRLQPPRLPLLYQKRHCQSTRIPIPQASDMISRKTFQSRRTKHVTTPPPSENERTPAGRPASEEQNGKW
ncbi:hypothetical protein Dda_8281 [Drechslerella dactyloides]|uniref:DNA mismatch repair protein MSH5 n=1 Tax=Drechslerella dactyloides TaxID=74499 RepID=A0AAD6NGJ7_DREDA|nr:hypothetical protein Dda_8281 [Drechslerella dactyloides]